MQQITRGDYLKDLITIFIENNLQQDITDLYSQFIFQCGAIQKTFTPAQVIKISFNEQESLQLKNINVCYLAGITSDGHKETFNGSLTFNTRGEVVMYEPANISAANVTTSDAPQCSCQGLNAVYSNCCQPAIKAYFSLNYVPTKLSELQNDTDFQDSVDVSDAISEHNTSEDAHQYIQELISTAELNINTTIGDLTNLETSVKSSVVNAINSEVSARENADTGLSNDYNAKIGTLSNLESSVKTDVVSAINSVISDTDTTIGDLTDLDTSVKTSVVNAINSEVSDRISADNDLQGQIDALSAASDVTDIVGTYAELQAYDTQHLNDNDIIKVLSDSTHNNAPSYYRYNKSTDSFTYIGSESASYTKAESDALFVPQTRTVNSKALSSDITLTSSDVGALASTTTINDLTTTAQQNALNSGATSAKINQIATNTGNITTNANAISTINGKIPADASSSNKLVTASALSNAVVNLANQDLSNLTETGNDRLHALKGYEDAGELLTDAEGLTDVNDYARSTFDVSKFTVTGSPTITNGVVSNVSNSDYITMASSFLTSSTWKMIVPLPKGSTGWGGIISKPGINSLQVNLNSATIAYSLSSNGTSWDIGSSSFILTDLDTTKDALFVLEFTGTEYKMYAIQNGTILTGATITNSSNIYNNGSALVFGQNRSLNSPTNGTIDLKQVLVYANGVPVFSGNKTGVDTIKPDNYTVVGTPTITDDGVVSGFSSGNYITKAIPLNTKWKFIFKNKYATASTAQTSLSIVNSANNRVIVRLWSRANSPDCQIVPYRNNNTFTAIPFNCINNHEYEYIVWNDGTNINYQVKDLTDNSTVIEGVQSLGDYSIGSISANIFLGVNSSNSEAFNGSIDLNSFKIYVGGNLVYQPCLKIPYTLSKTGSKIVNSIYRDRVNDMASQFGSANYYTLDEDNSNFTLPKGELYGLIGDKTLRDSYYNGVTYWELFSNRRLEQGGSCESGVEYTFSKPFTDANYVLTIPYSSKTATSFIPSATGDFIAKGQGAL